MLRLQQLAGNQAVAGLVHGPPEVQRLELEDLGRVGLSLGLALLGIDTTPRPGIKRPTAQGGVWVREVPPSTPFKAMGDGELKLERSSGAKPSDQLHDAYGSAASQVVVEYTIRRTKDGRFVALVVHPRLTTTVRLLPDSEFNTIDEFAPYYKEFKEDYGGDRALYAALKARMGSGPGALFGKFATVEGTLHHENLHAYAQRRDAKRRERMLYAEASNQVADDPDTARKMLVAAVERAWDGFPTEGDLDHVEIYERQCNRLIDAYERANPPAGGR